MTDARKNYQFRKSRTFIAGLAVRQRRPKIALDVLNDDENYFYVTIRHIRLLAWAQLGQFNKVFEMFETIVRRTEKENMHFKTSIEVVSPYFKNISTKIQFMNIIYN